MRWLTGGSFTILACTVVVGCAGVPGRPTSQQADRVQSADAVTPGQSADGTTAGSAQEPGTQPTSPAPQIPSPRVPPRSTKLPGVPGSPITYDNTLLGASPESAKESIEGEIGGKCGPDLCGVRVVTRPRGSEGCVSEISPMPVDPGGTVTVYHGPQCAEQRGELPAEQLPTEEPRTTPETEAETPPETPGTTGGGGG